MGLETGVTYISDLDAANPTATDGLNQADDHLRNIKNAIQNTFPTINGAVNASQAELNRNVGLTENLTDSLEEAAPVGSIVMWPVSIAPTGWLLCDGSAVSRSTYADLFALLDDDYGAGDGSTTFNLPDFRGQFVRGTDNGAGVDPDAASRTDRGDATTGDNVGTLQADELASHTHTEEGTGSTSPGFSSSVGGNQLVAQATNTGTTGGNETRPVNIGMNFIIKH